MNALPPQSEKQPCSHPRLGSASSRQLRTGASRLDSQPTGYIQAMAVPASNFTRGHTEQQQECRKVAEVYMSRKFAQFCAGFICGTNAAQAETNLRTLTPVSFRVGWFLPINALRASSSRTLMFPRIQSMLYLIEYHCSKVASSYGIRSLANR